MLYSKFHGKNYVPETLFGISLFGISFFLKIMVESRVFYEKKNTKKHINIYACVYIDLTTARQ